jgi:hypothetical protein
VRSSDIVTWLKADFKLGHGHASAIAHLIVHAEDRTGSPDHRVRALFGGHRARWRQAYDALAAKIATFGASLRRSIVTAGNHESQVFRRIYLTPATSVENRHFS